MNELILVTAVILIVWIGIAAYMFMLDKRISKIEKDLNEK